ncbi:MAG: nucleoside-diphosphate kinase [Candidatus Micrarchaeaceae archaeon]
MNIEKGKRDCSAGVRALDIVSVLRTTTGFVIEEKSGSRIELQLDGNTTLGILKPDTITRGIEKVVYARIAEDGLGMLITDRRKLVPKDICFLYPAHVGKPYFSEIEGFMTSCECEIFLAHGANALQRLNALVGNTDPSKAVGGTIRGDLYAKQRALPQFPNVYQNVLHSSSSIDDSKREIVYFLRIR